MKTQDELIAEGFCGAKLRKKDAYCQKRPLTGRTRCKLHGGASLTGREHPRYKHGRRASTLPKRLLANYQDAMTDPELLSLRTDIAVMDARINDLLQRVDIGEAGALWKQARTAMKKFKSARSSTTMEADTKRAIMAEALDELEEAIKKGNADYSAWNEVHKTVEARRRLIDSEHKRAVAMGQMMSAEAVLTLADAIMNIIESHVPEQDTRVKMGRSIMLLMGEGFDQTAFNKEVPHETFVEGEYAEVS